MSEIKRVALNTLEPQKVNDKVIKKVCKTVRISVNLSESNEDNCPEYNYKDQLAAVVKRKEKVKPVKDSNGVENGLDPFGENDDDVRRIALEMEAKYGTGVTTKKKRKGKKDDYADIGMGYDESDSFIDNTDGYDEIIPQNVTTLHGGFYVNSGALVFKTDDEATSNASSSASSSSDSSSSSESEGEDKEKPKTASRKRILDTSADSDSDTANNAQKEKKPKVQSPANSMQQAIKKKLFSTSKIQKQRPVDPLKKTVKDLLREKREDLNMTVPDELKDVEDNIEKESSKENKKPMSITSVTDAIESVLKQVVEEDFDKDQIESPSEVTSAVLIQNKNDMQSKEKENKQNLTRLEKEEVVKLPDLPADIEAIVSSLKEAALNYKGEGKKAFFTKEVNTLLLNLEKKSRSISKSSRVRVYEHLSQYVNCTKDTLRRRARILDLEDNEKRLKSLQIKLKDAIDAVMPELKENYQLESQKILQKKFSKESENNEELKALKLPRRKFTWNEETKKLLKDILSVKKRCLVIEGKNKDNLLEEQVVDYLRNEIVPLWPEGWMYLNALKKILNRMQDTSKSSTSSVSNSINTSTQKHSNLSITPVTNGKNSVDKPEITNSITVTKVVNSSEANVGDSVKSSKKTSEVNHVTAINVVKENDVPNSREVDNVYKDYVNKYSKSQESVSKPESKEKTPDLTVFKPYIEEAATISQAKLPSDLSKPKTYSKPSKQTEMFKPYADTEIISVEKNIPDKPKSSSYGEDKCLTIADVITSYSEQEVSIGHSYSDKEKHSGHSFSEKQKHGAPIQFEKDKYSSHLYSAKEEHLPRTYSDRDKHSSQVYPEKDKHSSQSYSDKDKHTSSIYLDKEKHTSHTYSEKDKSVPHTYSEKDHKHSSHAYAEKDKHVPQNYSEKDKHTTHTYPDKDKHTYSEKDKHTPDTYSERDKHTLLSYADKDKHPLRTYSEKDKHALHTYSEKDKHALHTYSEKDKHSLHSFSEKDKQSPHNYAEKDRHTVHSYAEKDKHILHTYPDKEKPTLHNYAEKDKHSLYSYSEKEKHSVHTYAEKDKRSLHTYVEKDKLSLHTYAEKDKHSLHTYADKDKHTLHTHAEKDKHSLHTYAEKDKHSLHTYAEKDKHSLHTYAEKDKHTLHTHAEKDKHSVHTYAEKDKHSLHAYAEKDKHAIHNYAEKDNKHSLHTYAEKDKHSVHTYADKDKHTLHTYSEKDKRSFHTYAEKDKHSSHLDKKIEERAAQLEALPANLTKPSEKPTDLSKFQMFKPYSDTPKSHSEESSSYISKEINKHQKPIDYKTKEEKHHRSGDISKVVSSMSQDSSSFSTIPYGTQNDYLSSRYDASSKHRTQNSHHHTNIGNDHSTVVEDSGVIVKNLQPKEKIGREDKMDHLNPVIPKAAHCQGVKRKLLENYSRSSAEITASNYYSVASSKHAEYSTTPLVTNKSEGDGQKDIQMVMENLKALQKLSCSPIKNDSSSSPVSVIAYNKTFTTSKTTTTTSSNHSRNDMNSRSEFSGGFQDEFQKQFINSLQQMAANTNNNKSGYNNGS